MRADRRRDRHSAPRPRTAGRAGHGSRAPQVERRRPRQAPGRAQPHGSPAPPSTCRARRSRSARPGGACRATLRSLIHEEGLGQLARPVARRARDRRRPSPGESVLAARASARSRDQNWCRVVRHVIARDLQRSASPRRLLRPTCTGRLPRRPAGGRAPPVRPNEPGPSRKRVRRDRRSHRVPRQALRPVRARRARQARESERQPVRRGRARG